jgi:hypothetical protein
MEISEELIAKIVRAVIEALQAQGTLPVAGRPSATCGSGWREPAPVPTTGTETVTAKDGRRLLLTEEMVRRYASKGCRRLRVPADALVTPLARDLANEKRIEIVRI